MNFDYDFSVASKAFMEEMRLACAKAVGLPPHLVADVLTDDTDEPIIVGGEPQRGVPKLAAALPLFLELERYKKARL